MILDGKKKPNMDRAVDLIRAGHAVAFPTETVYGLGANATNEKAVEEIFRIKGRPKNDPLIVHISDRKQLNDLVYLPTGELLVKVEKLIKRFWPGPLTLVFKKKPIIPDNVTSGLTTVGVRMPRHLVALALIKNADCPIAAPSANRFQSISPTTALDVEKELGDDVDLILDGGPCDVGLESTVLSVIEDIAILRHGGISQEDLETTLDEPIGGLKSGSSVAHQAPGQMLFHYAPKKNLRFFSKKDLLVHIKKRGVKKTIADASLICFSKDEEKLFRQAGFKRVLVLSVRGNFNEAAKKLFSILRSEDESDAKLIYALECPDERLGRALNDRLKKADHENKKIK